MAKCRYLSECDFFEQPLAQSAPETMKQVKKMYCFDDHAACARFMIWDTVGLEYLPRGITPEQTAWAKEVIKAELSPDSPPEQATM